MNYALVENGIVTNVIWLYEGNENDFPQAVKLNDRPVAIGDSFDGKDFFRKNEKVLSHFEAELMELKARLESIRDCLDGLATNPSLEQLKDFLNTIREMMEDD